MKDESRIARAEASPFKSSPDSKLQQIKCHHFFKILENLAYVSLCMYNITNENGKLYKVKFKDMCLRIGTDCRLIRHTPRSVYYDASRLCLYD